MKTLRLYLKTCVGEKREKLLKFGEGAKKHGINVDYYMGTEFKPSDYAMIFAYKSDDIISPSHLLRQEVVDKKKDKQIFFVDSNVLGYYERKNKAKKYRRIPFKSIHPHEADFLPVDEDSFKRTEQVKKDLGLELKPWRKTGEHILLSLNRGIGGFSSFGMPCYKWAREMVQKIRLYTDRKIIIRSHRHVKITPSLQQDRENLDWILKNVKNVSLSSLESKDILDDIKNAWATVVFTTTSGAISLMEGVPVFTCHPACFYRLYGSGDIAQIENPRLPDREQFLTYYANAHWNLDEIKSGKLWEKFIRYRDDNIV